ncbi:MAG: hypothetical protein IJ131_08675 [Eggerthellaceae bacterium]|nr:hypothetical protein [Eggerthellaceae bacterium]
MPVDGTQVDPSKFGYARYPASTFTTLPEALVRALIGRQVGRNGWAVLTVLCRMVYTDGRLGTVGAEKVAETTGLTLAQVARGMRDLRQRGIIAPVIRKNARGYRHLDKPCFGHVAQYCICKDIWAAVELKPERPPDAAQRESMP